MESALVAAPLTSPVTGASCHERMNRSATGTPAVLRAWVVSVGGEADAALPASSLEEVPLLHVARRRARRAAHPRLLRCFRRGVLTILAALLQGDPLPLGRFLPEPWPCSTPGVALSPPLLCLPAGQAA